jgi:hypothetical protein
VNDKTSNPDRPDRSGTVATGDQQAARDGGGGPTPKSGNGAAPSAGPSAGPTSGSSAAPSPGRGEGQSTAAGVRPDESTRAVPPDAETAETASEPGAPSGLFAEHRVEGADAPTARIRLPEANGTAKPGTPAKPAAGAKVPAPAPAPAKEGIPARPSPGRPPGKAEAKPAPDEVEPDDAVATRSLGKPAPTPAAPPPWNRVPGKEAAAEAPARPVVTTDASVGELLQEGPTTYIDVADRGIAPPKSAEEDGDSSSRSGSWPGRSGRNRPPRQAALQLKRLDPWSVLKLALVLAVVLFFIWLVAVGVLYGVLDGMGVWDKLNGTYSDLVSGEAAGGSPLISAGRVLGLAAVVGAINSLLFAVAVTVAAFVYNVSADLVGGIEVTLSERD